MVTNRCIYSAWHQICCNNAEKYPPIHPAPAHAVLSFHSPGLSTQGMMRRLQTPIVKQLSSPCIGKGEPLSSSLFFSLISVSVIYIYIYIAALFISLLNSSLQELFLIPTRWGQLGMLSWALK